MTTRGNVFDYEPEEKLKFGKDYDIRDLHVAVLERLHPETDFIEHKPHPDEDLAELLTCYVENGNWISSLTDREVYLQDNVLVNPKRNVIDKVVRAFDAALSSGDIKELTANQRARLERLRQGSKIIIN